MRIFILGFRDQELTSEEQSILDSLNGKYQGADWSQGNFKLTDQRDANFAAAKQTLEEDREIKIAVYGDFDLPSMESKAALIECIKDAQNQLSGFNFEIHTESEKLL